MGYCRPGAPSIFPPDRATALPARSFSYKLQRRVKAAVQNPFPGSVPTIAELTGVSVSKRCLEEILPDAARDQQRSMATAAGSVLVAAVDGKDILHGQASAHNPRVLALDGDRLRTAKRRVRSGAPGEFRRGQGRM
jgi:hypothetical protein